MFAAFTAAMPTPRTTRSKDRWFILLFPATRNVFAIGARFLDGWAGNAAEGAEYATIALTRSQLFAATPAIVEKPAGIGWHGFDFGFSAVRAGERRAKLHGSRSLLAQHEYEGDQAETSDEQGKTAKSNHKSQAETPAAPKRMTPSGIEQ